MCATTPQQDEFFKEPMDNIQHKASINLAVMVFFLNCWGLNLGDLHMPDKHSATTHIPTAATVFNWEVYSLSHLEDEELMIFLNILCSF